MKRAIAATLLAGGVMSSLALAAPTAGALPSAVGISCAEYSSMSSSEKREVVEAALRARPSHSLANMPATTVVRVTSECRQLGNDSTRITTIVNRLDGGSSSSLGSPSLSGHGSSTSCAVFTRLDRSEQAAIMRVAVSSSSRFHGRYNTAAALVEGACKSQPTGTVGQALIYLEHKYR